MQLFKYTKKIEQMQEDNFTIYTDSKSLLQALENLEHPHAHIRIIQEIDGKLKQKRENWNSLLDTKLNK